MLVTSMEQPEAEAIPQARHFVLLEGAARYSRSASLAKNIFFTGSLHMVFSTDTFPKGRRSCRMRSTISMGQRCMALPLAAMFTAERSDARDFNLDLTP